MGRIELTALRSERLRNLKKVSAEDARDFGFSRREGEGTHLTFGNRLGAYACTCLFSTSVSVLLGDMFPLLSSIPFLSIVSAVIT